MFLPKHKPQLRQTFFESFPFQYELKPDILGTYYTQIEITNFMLDGFANVDKDFNILILNFNRQFDTILFRKISILILKF